MAMKHEGLNKAFHVQHRREQREEAKHLLFLVGCICGFMLWMMFAIFVPVFGIGSMLLAFLTWVVVLIWRAYFMKV